MVVVEGCVVDMGYQLLDVLFLLLYGRLAIWWVWGVWVWVELRLFGGVVAVWLWLWLAPGVLAA